MHVGNNRPVGPQQNEASQTPLDPDLTRANREGVKFTRERVGELSTAAREEAIERQEAARLERAESEVAQPSRGDLSRETVELSTQSRRLAADELPGPGGERESAEVRAARVESLREAHDRGELNSTERLRKAAGRLLGGE